MSALDKFMERHSPASIRKLFNDLPWLPSWTVGAASLAIAFGISAINPDTPPGFSRHNEIVKGLLEGGSPTTTLDVREIENDKERFGDRRTALVAAAAALNRIAIASDSKSDHYTDDASGREMRARDLRVAIEDYTTAVADADHISNVTPSLDTEASSPFTSWHSADFQFSLDAIEALGGDVDAARKSGRYVP